MNSVAITGIVVGGGVGFMVGIVVMLWENNLAAKPGKNEIPIVGTLAGAGVGYYLANNL